MNLKGTHQLPFPRRVVWEALLDPAVLSRTLPGCESLTKVGEGTFQGRLMVAVGPVRGVFAGTLALSEIDPPNGYRMKLEGRGPSGFMQGEGRVTLQETEGGTELGYDLEAMVGGKLAGVGQRVLDSSAKAVAGQGLAGLERVLQAIANPVAPGAPVAETGAAAPRELPPPPSQTSFALAVARETVADLVPKDQRLAIATLAVFLLGLLTGWALGRSK
jgi:carbon monoxide dehydrogenase subunit G